MFKVNVTQSAAPSSLIMVCFPQEYWNKLVVVSQIAHDFVHLILNRTSTSECNENKHFVIQHSCILNAY